MDILAHMLWANYGARTVNKTLLKKGNQKKINLGWVTFWGVFPDLFAFSIPVLFTLPSLIMNGKLLRQPPQAGLAPILYQYSHSIVIWIFVFSIIWITFKRPRLELLGWALHILIDIPSHSATFYPTPFLFPISNYRFIDGISWVNPWYMIINYSLLLIVSLYFFTRKKNSKATIPTT